MEEGVSRKILACLPGKNNHGRQFLLPVGKMDKPGKHFDSWLYETEDQNTRNCPGKTSGRELLHRLQVARSNRRVRRQSDRLLSGGRPRRKWDALPGTR